MFAFINFIFFIFGLAICFQHPWLFFVVIIPGVIAEFYVWWGNRNMTHKIDGKLLGLPTGEYELAPGVCWENIDSRDEYIVLKRLPEQDNLETIAMKYGNYKETEAFIKSFQKAISIASSCCIEECCVTDKLRKFAGLKID